MALENLQTWSPVSCHLAAKAVAAGLPCLGSSLGSGTPAGTWQQPPAPCSWFLGQPCLCCVLLVGQHRAGGRPPGVVHPSAWLYSPQHCFCILLHRFASLSTHLRMTPEVPRAVWGDKAWFCPDNTIFFFFLGFCLSGIATRRAAGNRRMMFDSGNFWRTPHLPFEQFCWYIFLPVPPQPV